MGIIPILASLVNIAKGEDVELLLSTSAGCIHREQYWPSDAAANKADECEHLEEPQVQIAIQRLVRNQELVRN